MTHLKIGIAIESLGLPLRKGLEQAQRLGAAGVQVAAAGELSPKTLSQTGRRAFLHLLSAHNLQAAALACPLRHGLDTALGLEGRIDYVKQVQSLSYDLGARLVIVEAGRIPADAGSTPDRLLTEALQALGHHGDRTGTALALATGAESGSSLRSFLDRFDTGGLGAAIDPANLLLNAFDPYESARALSGRIVYALARDARRSGASRAGQEVPLGHGDIDWMYYLSVLEEVEYRGWLTVIRESGDNRVADVAAGMQFLRGFVP
jgi:sugar phosphate isomerase/epimerase